MTFPEAVAAITALEPRGWKLGLERMTEFVRRIGLERAVRERHYVHVAGTNGKGSTTSFVQSILVASGVKTGGFFSPYVIDPRERVQLNGHLISKEDFASLTEELLAYADAFDDSEFGGISEFEFKTALGFLYWERKGAEWVALETGLGGRLDSTNVVTPAVSVIVSIGLDHESILGDTVEKIAFEKAGIIKSGRPVVIGQMPLAAREVIENVAREKGSPIWRFGEEICLEGDRLVTPATSIGPIKPGMVGVWQPHNLALAISALQLAGAPITEEGIQAGARAAAPPGRFQRFGKIILDGAHNQDSGKALAKTLEAELQGRKLTLVTNMLVGHDPEAFYRPLLPHVARSIVAPIGFHRARDPKETAEMLTRLGFQAEVAPTIAEALEMAGTEDVLVTGSFYLVGEVARHLGIGEGVSL